MEQLLDSVHAVVTDQTIMFVLLLTGLYYKVSAKRSTQLVARAYCVLCAAASIQIYYTLISTIYKDDVLSKLSSVLAAVLYIINVFVYFVYDGESYFCFRRDLLKLDFMLSIKTVEHITVSKVLFFIVVLQKLINGVIIFADLSRITVAAVMDITSVTIVLLTTTISSITKIMMLESLHYRMKILHERFQRVLTAARRFEEGEHVVTGNLHEYMNIYKNLLDTVELSGAPMKIMMFWTTVTVIPRSLLFMYEIITSTVYQRALYIVVDRIFSLLIPFVPGIYVELIISEVDKIRLCVVKQLLVYKDTNARYAIINAIKYLDYRPFKYTIWRLLTVDLGLILTMFGLVTTYTVAMIQFTHIYD